MGYDSRKPTSNDPLPLADSENPYGATATDREFGLDNTALLLNEQAHRCAKCHRVTKNRYLDERGMCPPCSPT